MEDHQAEQQQEQRALWVSAPLAEKLDADDTAHRYDQVGDDQAGEGRQQLAGEHLRAADRFAQQEVGRQLVLFDRDQPEAVVARLDRQAELDEYEGESVKTQHGGQVDLIQTEGGPQLNRVSCQKFVHHGGLVGKYRVQGEIEDHDERHTHRPDDHRLEPGAEFVLINIRVHGLCLFVVVHEDFFQRRLLDGHIGDRDSADLL